MLRVRVDPLKVSVPPSSLPMPPPVVAAWLVETVLTAIVAVPALSMPPPALSCAALFMKLEYDVERLPLDSFSRPPPWPVDVLPAIVE